MICCTIAAALLGALLWPLSRMRGNQSPLAWRPPGSTANQRSARFTLSARVRSFRFALEGLRYLLHNEHNAWLHLAASMGAIAAGFILGISASDWRWVAISVGLVWVAEALNTAIERLCDLVSPQLHPLVKAAKDLGAGAVLICAAVAAILGSLTFYPYVFERAECCAHLVNAHDEASEHAHRLSMGGT